MKTVILTNVGTPRSASLEDVGAYLCEFLMDENIIQVPRPFRDILVKGLIVPKRKNSSAEKYQRIWTAQGSPLMVESRNLRDHLQKQLGTDWQVLLAMQVGKPSIKEVFEQVQGPISEIYFCPLYPQYATATTGGAVKAAKKYVPSNVQIKILAPFYSENWFLQTQAQVIREKLQPGDHLLLSYHSLPVSQLTDHKADCDISSGSRCCADENACAKNCYKAQCLKTSDLLKDELQWGQVSVGFQSRLGGERWIDPSTEQVVENLLKRGVQNLKVACPSFVADCLETLEEIGIGLKHKFLRGGGKSFELIPCVNSHSRFVTGLSQALIEMNSIIAGSDII